MFAAGSGEPVFSGLFAIGKTKPSAKQKFLHLLSKTDTWFVCDKKGNRYPLSYWWTVSQKGTQYHYGVNSDTVRFMASGLCKEKSALAFVNKLNASEKYFLTEVKKKKILAK